MTLADFMQKWEERQNAEICGNCIHWRRYSFTGTWHVGPCNLIFRRLMMGRGYGEGGCPDEAHKMETDTCERFERGPEGNAIPREENPVDAREVVGKPGE